MLLCNNKGGKSLKQCKIVINDRTQHRNLLILENLYLFLVATILLFIFELIRYYFFSLKEEAIDQASRIIE